MNPPSSALVGVAWLRTLPLAAGIGTGRPAKVEEWAATGFVVVSTVGSAGTPDLPQQRRPVLSLDSWGATLSSGRPPKNQTAGTLELIRRQVESFGLAVTVNPGAGYSQALITDAWLVAQEAREAPDPDPSFAHYVQEVALAWVPLD